MLLQLQLIDRYKQGFCNKYGGGGGVNVEFSVLIHQLVHLLPLRQTTGVKLSLEVRRRSDSKSLGQFERKEGERKRRGKRWRE